LLETTKLRIIGHPEEAFRPTRFSLRLQDFFLSGEVAENLSLFTPADTVWLHRKVDRCGTFPKPHADGPGQQCQLRYKGSAFPSFSQTLKPHSFNKQLHAQTSCRMLVSYRGSESPPACRHDMRYYARIVLASQSPRSNMDHASTCDTTPR
jgi:hypothetical protein